MPVFRYFISVGPALLALLVIIDAIYGEGPPRFNDAIYKRLVRAARRLPKHATGARLPP